MSGDVFEYAALRAVPRVDRGEYVNIGVLLYCQQQDFLALAVRIDAPRLHALAADADVEGVTAAAAALQRTCDGEGPAGLTSAGQRFRWLTAPRSTVLQAGPVHSGLTVDAGAELARLTGVLLDDRG